MGENATEKVTTNPISSENYMEKLQKEPRIRYKQKLELIGLERCPFELQMEEQKWTSDPTQWPEHTYPHLYHYLIKSPRIYSQEAMEKYKSLEAFKFYIAGWVQEIKHMKVNDVILVIADVRPSYKTTNKPHSAWVVLKNSGSVVYGHCKCMAGLDETCSHVGAILFKMEAAVRIGFTRVTPTDLPQLWNQNFTKNIDGALVANIMIYSDKAKAKLKASEQPTPPLKAVKLDYFEDFLKNVKEHSPETVALSLFGEHQERFVVQNPPQETRPKLPQSLRYLYNSNNVNLALDDYNLLVEKTMADLKAVPLESYVYVEEATHNQSLSFAWYQQRAGRITGSTFQKICKSTPDNFNKNVIKGICSDKIKRINARPLVWGRDKESEALALYCESQGNPNYIVGDCQPIMSCLDCYTHSDFDMKSFGLSIYFPLPWFAASPDSVVYCSCCSYGVVEVKCPYTIGNNENLSLKQEILNDNFYVKFCEATGSYYLEQDHQYYYQMQLEMLATDTNYCDFFVWTPKEYLTIRIDKNLEFLGEKVYHCDMFWQRIILHELLTRQLELEVIPDDTPEDGEKCSICSNDEDYMMKCKTCFKFFHPKCVGRKTLAKPGTWSCKPCRKSKN